LREVALRQLLLRQLASAGPAWHYVV